MPSNDRSKRPSTPQLQRPDANLHIEVQQYNLSLPTQRWATCQMASTLGCRNQVLIENQDFAPRGPRRGGAGGSEGGASDYAYCCGNKECCKNDIRVAEANHSEAWTKYVEKWNRVWPIVDDVVLEKAAEWAAKAYLEKVIAKHAKCSDKRQNLEAEAFSEQECGFGELLYSWHCCRVVHWGS
jgi:hypothetical protein